MRPLSYAGYRFPPEIIQHAIWLYLRFTLSFRDVEELLAERGIDVSHETIRRWVAVFGPLFKMVRTSPGFLQNKGVALSQTPRFSLALTACLSMFRGPDFAATSQGLECLRAAVV